MGLGEDGAGCLYLELGDRDVQCALEQRSLTSGPRTTVVREVRKVGHACSRGSPFSPGLSLPIWKMG